uniref:Uncharacterized protein n=1 Tax=Heterorhabditis bacteriophora TaxID=37862 RepID=A0A1I7X7J3_HETBA
MWKDLMAISSIRLTRVRRETYGESAPSGEGYHEQLPSAPAHGFAMPPSGPAPSASCQCQSEKENKCNHGPPGPKAYIYIYIYIYII